MKKIIILIGVFLSVHKAYTQTGGFIRQASEANWAEVFSSNTVQTATGAIPGIIGAANAGGDIPTLNIAECTPDFSETSNARMNDMCGSPESDCQMCFDEARDHMDFYRRQLARLNCIYQNTKNFTNGAVAFGDAASGIHAMTAIAWQRERVKIMASMTQLKQTYDTKYLEFIQGLKTSLMEFDRCEFRFGQGDWFQKSGFIYFEFMKERYKRND